MKSKFANTMELYLRFIYLTMFIVSFMFYQKMNVFYKLFTLLIVLDLVFLLIGNYKKKHYDLKIIILIGVLLFTHFITALVNYDNNFIGNLIEIVFMFSYCLIGVVYNKDNIDKLFKIYAYFIQGVTFFIAISVMIFLTMNYFVVLRITENKRYFLGVFKGRIWPLFNPNSMASLSYISIVLAIILINMCSGKKNIFLKINIFLQFVFLSVLQSRGSFLTCSAMIVLYILFINKKYSVWYKKLMQIVVFLAIFLALIFSFNTGVNILLDKKPHDLSQIVYVDNNFNVEYEGENGNSSDMESEEEYYTQNEEQLQIRFNEMNSNGRMYIWEKAFVMISKKPIFGYGTRNIKRHFPEGLDETIIHNQNFHNIFLNVWVSSGILSLIVFLIIVFYVAYRFLYYLIKGNNSNTKLVILLFFGILLTQMFESDILYVTSFLNTFFWFIVGYGLYLSEGKQEQS